MDFITNLFSSDVFQLIAIALTFVIGLLVNNKAIAAKLTILVNAWAKIGVIMNEVDDVHESAAALYKKITDYSADQKLTPEEVKDIVDSAALLKKEIADVVAALGIKK